jgi:NAD+ diphosphatase
MDHAQRSALNSYTANPIDRAPAARRDGKWVRSRLADPDTRLVPLWRLEPLVRLDKETTPVFIAPTDFPSLASAPDALTLLGVLDRRAYFALDLPDDGSEWPPGLAALGRFQDLRRLSAILGDREGGLLAYARAMVYWRRRHRFCGECGMPTQPENAGHLLVCTNERCGRRHFPRTDPAVIVQVESRGRCLLARQSHWPDKRYSVIAGYVEPGESAEDAVAREVREETSIETGRVSYHSSQPWPFPGSLMLGFCAEARTEQIELLDGELAQAAWFDRRAVTRAIRNGGLKLPPRFSIAFRLVEDWFDAGELGPLADVLKGSPDGIGELIAPRVP